MPSFKAGDNSIPTSFTGQPVTLQSRKQEQNGRANQKWAFESDTGIIDAFAAEIKDIGKVSFQGGNALLFHGGQRPEVGCAENTGGHLCK